MGVLVGTGVSVGSGVGVSLGTGVGGTSVAVGGTAVGWLRSAVGVFSTLKMAVRVKSGVGNVKGVGAPPDGLEQAAKSILIRKK